MQELYNAIEKYAVQNIDRSKNDSMSCPDLKYCLIEVDNHFNRGKIYGVNYVEDAIELKVLLVDTGLTKVVNLECVYDIPDELVQMLPFQVHSVISI